MADIKTLRVCLSSDLPDILERDSNYIYFTYDKLMVYQGQNKILDNFVIADKVPDDPVYGMMYFITDGTVHKIIDYSDTVIANIEDESQIQYIKDAGNQYFNNYDHRYIDKRNRTMILPYNDGSYQLVVSTKNNDTYNNQSYVKFDEDTNQFSLNSNESYEWVNYSKFLKGASTKTIRTNIKDGKIEANLRINESLSNMLQIASDGLYVNASSKLDKEEYQDWIEEIESFVKMASGMLDNINDELSNLSDLITEANITTRIKEYLNNRISEIQTYIDAYDRILATLDTIQASTLAYANNTINNAINEIESNFYKSGSWDNLDTSSTDYEQEIDYYSKTIDPADIVPKTEEDIIKVITAAIYAYILSDTDNKNKQETNDNNEDNDLNEEDMIKIISAAISGYLVTE